MEALRRNWGVYLTEAWGLGMFMTGASILTTLLEYPGSPLHQAVPAMGWRLVILGVGMGFVVAGIVYSPWGKRSGAHINPSVTWAFFRLGKIKIWDAVFYTVAQFAGAILTIQLMRLLLGAPYRDMTVNYAMPQVGSPGVAVAFAAEFAISFLLMIVLLFMVNRKALEKWVGAIIAALIALYLFFETPLSGMSLNPARTFGSAVAAHEWRTLWVYFLGPTLAMLLAAEIYYRCQGRHLDGPSYPVEKSEDKQSSEEME